MSIKRAIAKKEVECEFEVTDKKIIDRTKFYSVTINDKEIKFDVDTNEKYKKSFENWLCMTIGHYFNNNVLVNSKQYFSDIDNRKINFGRTPNGVMNITIDCFRDIVSPIKFNITEDSQRTELDLHKLAIVARTVYDNYYIKEEDDLGYLGEYVIYKSKDNRIHISYDEDKLVGDEGDIYRTYFIQIDLGMVHD